MEDNKHIQIEMKKIPAFTVIKNGSILKNIFLLRKKSDKPSQNQESDEEYLYVGRHPQCHITLEHPSISRYHLRIHSNPSSQFLSVQDLSSVHGTWVSGRRIEAGVDVMLKEGDTVKLGGSSRVYELHWVPRSQAFDVDQQFVPAVYTIKEGGEEEDETNKDEKHEEYSSNDDLECLDLSTSNKNPLTSGNENDSIQSPLVSETTSATQLSDGLTASEDHLMANSSKSSCDDTEVEQSSSLKNEEFSSVDDLECSNLSTSNTIHGSPLKTLNPLPSGNENDDIFATVSIQAPLVVSETEVSDSLNDSEDPLIENSSKSFCDDTEVEQESPSETGNGNDELTTVCIEAPLVASEAISETEMSDCLNKAEDKLNCLTDNLSNEFDQISHGTVEDDDMDSIDLFNAIETNERDALGQNIARSNETDIANENQQKLVLYDGVNLDVKFESFDNEIMKKESAFCFLPDVADVHDDKTFTPDISKGKEIDTNLLSTHKLSDSMKLFDRLDGKELELYTPDKENKNPNACSGKSLSKKAVNSVDFKEKDIFGFPQKLFATDEGMYITQEEVNQFANCEDVLNISSEEESKSIQMVMEKSCNNFNYPQTVQKAVNSVQNLVKNRWTMVVDTNSLLDPKSLKHLKLLEGIKGTQLFVPKNVVRELMDFKCQENYFKRSSKKVSLALKWIDERMMKTRWWINMYDDDGETAHSSKSKEVSLALKWIDECMMKTRWWINMDDNDDDDDDETAHSSKAVPEVLAYALHLHEEITDQKIIILSDNLTLKIKAMAEGIMCETAEEFHKSLVNPFSERFMWVGSSARGLTWSCVDDVDDIVRQKYHGSGLNGSNRFKGLKLLARVTTSQLIN